MDADDAAGFLVAAPSSVMEGEVFVAGSAVGPVSLERTKMRFLGSTFRGGFDYEVDES